MPLPTSSFGVPDLPTPISSIIDSISAFISTHQTLTITTAVLAAYLLLVRSLRWRRYYAIHKKYEEKWRKEGLTPAEAQEIMHTSVFWDQPLLMNKSLAFALFKSYGNPRTSKLLVATKQLSTSENIAKRYADTEILISTWVACPITGFTGDPSTCPVKPSKPAEDPRAAIAIARMNFLHGKYNILNEDFLDTLALFVIEPVAWANKWGWRSLSPMEADAFLIFWRDIGEKMGIQDIPQTRKEMELWSDQFQAVHTVPDEANSIIAEHTMEEILCFVPSFLGIKALARRVAICLLEDRVRVAMLFPPQPRALHILVHTILHLRALFQRYLCLPRLSPSFPISLPLPTPNAQGEMRMRPSVYRSIPWYKPEPTSVVGKVLDKVLVKLGWYWDEAKPEYQSKGYLLELVGPAKFETSGREEVLKNAANLQGCAISAPWVATPILPSDGESSERLVDVE